ncbi:hypothetical protein UFO1_0695 [Pelosinus sp. UFO1]|nr:hypothetical protein UFO1_0695 [Pelosinus sp. UFO1]
MYFPAPFDPIRRNASLVMAKNNLLYTKIVEVPAESSDTLQELRIFMVNLLIVSLIGLLDSREPSPRVCLQYK